MNLAYTQGLSVRVHIFTHTHAERSVQIPFLTKKTSSPKGFSTELRPCLQEARYSDGSNSVLTTDTRGGGRRGRKDSVACFPRHPQDRRKALRHRKAGTMLYNHWSGESGRVFDVERAGLPAPSASRVHHMLLGQVSWEGRRRLSFSSQPVPSTPKNNTFLPTQPAHTRKALGTGVVGIAGLLEGSREERPWCRGV